MNRWFIHVDADAFFASVEQCIHRELRGKPIVTGRDGSIAVALSYEAKALGVQRATPIHMIRKEFPSVSVVVSDYYTYHIFSDRMVNIIQQYIPKIQRKSVDECSGEIFGLNTQEEVQQLAEKMQEELQTKLSCSFSFGISRSSLLAKMASGMNKPSGITIIDPGKDTTYQDVHIKKVSGLGTKLCERLGKMGVILVRDFIEKYPRIKHNFSITVEDIFYELQGVPRVIQRSGMQKSMNRARSFRITKNREEVYGQLVMNTEHLLRKMRAQKLVCSTIHISMRDIHRNYVGAKARLSKRTRDSALIYQQLQNVFNMLWNKTGNSRYVSVTLSGLEYQSEIQEDLFGEYQKEKKNNRLAEILDIIHDRFGKSLVTTGSTLFQPQSLGSYSLSKKYPITHCYSLLPGENINKRLRYPYLGKV